MKAVTFKSSWRTYFAGDTASFDDGVAQQLIDGGVADLSSGKKKGVARAADNKITDTGPVTNPPPGGDGDGDDDEPKP